MGGANRFYEENEAQDILRRALHQSDSGAIDRERLISMAAELGISEDAVARAEAQLATEREAELAKKQDELDRLNFRRRRRSAFWADLGSYLSVNAFMVAIWWFTGAGYFWPGWVLAMWGLGVASDFFGAFFGTSEAEFERWKRKQARKATRSRTVDARIETYLDEIAPMLEGRKIERIKAVRERFGLDLKEAKDAVEDFDARRGRM